MTRPLSNPSGLRARFHRLSQSGIAWMLFACVGYTLMAGATKTAVPESGLGAVVFWRSLAVAFGAWSIGRARGVAMAPTNHRLLLARSIVGSIAMASFFQALALVKIAVAGALMQTAPIFIVLLSRRLLGEIPDRRSLPLVVLAFIGVLLIVQPPIGGDAPWDPAALFALAAGLLAALAYLAVRRLHSTESTEGMVVYFGLVSAVLSAPFAFAGGLPDGFGAWGQIAVVSLGALWGQLCMTRAYSLEPAAVVGPFSYTTVVLTWLVGVIFFDETVNAVALVGGGAIVVAGVGILRLRR